MKKTIIYAIGTLFFSGKSPIMSGTVGSFVSLIPLAFCAYYFSPAQFSIILSLGIFLFTTLGVPVSHYIEKHESKEDPGIIVIDEAAGQWITFLFIPSNLMVEHIWIIPVGFFLFRFFDITKIFPAHLAERLTHGFGVMLDDIVAGLYSLVVLNLIIKFTII